MPTSYAGTGCWPAGPVTTATSAMSRSLARSDCHQGGGSGDNLTQGNFGRDDKPKSHRSDFVAIDPIKGADTTRRIATAAMTQQAFCNSCHSRFPSGEDAHQVAPDAGAQRAALRAGGERACHRGPQEPAVLSVLPPRGRRLHPVPREEAGPGPIPAAGRRGISRTEPTRRCASSATCREPFKQLSKLGRKNYAEDEVR